MGSRAPAPLPSPGLRPGVGIYPEKRLPRWTAFFLVTTVLTSVTGFLFPFVKLLPSHILAILSLIVLAVAIYALYFQHLAGKWRATYVVTAIIAQYFNVFVLIVQAFQKLPPFHALAPTQSEPPFAVAQGVNLLAFIALGYLATKRFHPASI